MPNGKGGFSKNIFLAQRKNAPGWKQSNRAQKDR